EQGDPRGEFLRLACEYDSLPFTEAGLGRALTRLEEIEPEIDPDWISSVMVGQVWLRYHKRAFSLLSEKPVISKNNVLKIERWEKKVGHQLPASLKEWYSLEGAEQRLGCRPEFSTMTLQRTLNRAARSADSENRSPHLGSIMRWFVGWSSLDECEVSLEGSDDPPVDRVLWAADTFSEFVKNLLWSNLTDTWWFEHEYDQWSPENRSSYPDFPMLYACEPAFSLRDISYLSKHHIKDFQRMVGGRWLEILDPFTREPRTYFKPTSLFHFYTRGVRLRIICLGNPKRRRVESHWEIFGDSVQELVDVVSQHLWGHRTLAKTLMASNEGGEESLAILRNNS
ncbi:MAG: hypothetical protein KDA84_19965, partial [Planctomycetaceae bacterium]|nr:hypothetical protein [Planctomycetaceae bacterium]